MARYWFGGGVADWTFTTRDGVGGFDDIAQVVGGSTITVWNAETGGTQFSDLLDANGAAVPFLLSDDGTGGRALGQIPPFQGPDGVTELWVSADGGPRARLVAAAAPAVEALSERVDVVETQADSLDERVGSAETAVAKLGHDPALRKWYAALGNRYAGIVSIVVMGDSNAEGTGATTSVRRRWQQVLQAELRSRFQPAGVTGALMPYVSASPRMILIPGDYSRTATAGVTESPYGLGSKSATIPSGESVTLGFTGRRAKLYARKGPEVGKYRIVLDGGTATVVDGSAASGSNSNVIWDSGTLTSGSHTVQISRDASTTLTPGSVYPEGLMTYDGDESAGLRVVDHSRGGAKLNDFTGLNAFNWFAAFGAIEGKSLLIMPWGANDSTGGTSAAQFRSDLESVISTCRSNGFASSVLLVEMPKRGNADPQVWADYRTQMEALAAADPDVALLDLRARIPDQGTAEANALGIYYDEVHYNDKGQGMIADQIATAIIPR
ncbi:SGNH/GDSL hydrolase family protein [Micromonospora chersina]|uniref:SGNH/GDSL hydrolase family protein n=1 Tax=Micromonospora chersina TaxID=47854 RepID=UPI00371E79D9